MMKSFFPLASAARPMLLLSVFCLAAKTVAPPRLFGADSAPADAKPQSRSWKDKGGTLSVEATFIELRDGKVGLKRSDGVRIDVPLEKLSAEDIKYVKSLEDTDNPFADSAIIKKGTASAEADAAFKGYKPGDLVEAYYLGAWVPAKVTGVDSSSGWVTVRLHDRALADIPANMRETFRTRSLPEDWVRLPGTGANTQPGARQEAKAARPKARPVDWHAAKFVQPKTFEKWSFKPDTAAPAIQPETFGKRIALEDIPKSEKFFERASIYVAGDGGHAIVARTEGKVARHRRHFIQAVNLAEGTTSGLVPMPEGTTVLDAWPEENLLLCGSEERDPATPLTLAKLEPKVLTPVSSWDPHMQSRVFHDVRYAQFLSRDRILTLVSGDSVLMVWDINTGKAVFNIPVNSSFGLRATLSPDRQLLAIVMENDVALIDL